MSDERNFTRAQQQIGGLFIFIISLGFIVWTWSTPVFNEYFYPKPAIIFPPFLFLGLGLMLFPDYRAERTARGEDISKLSGLRLLTARWWTILIVGLLAGFGNLILLKFFPIN